MKTKNKRIVVPCNNCKKNFAVKKPSKKIHNDGLEGRMTIYYITCPHCKEKFISFIETEKVKKLVKENKTRRKKLETIKDDDMYVETLNALEETISKIESIQKDLKLRFSKYV